jgi:hypothetical protein
MSLGLSARLRSLNIFHCWMMSLASSSEAMRWTSPGQLFAFKAVAPGGVYRLVRPEPDAQQIFHGLNGRGAGIVAHAGPKPTQMIQSASTASGAKAETWVTGLVKISCRAR